MLQASGSGGEVRMPLLGLNDAEKKAIDDETKAKLNEALKAFEKVFT